MNKSVIIGIVAVIVVAAGAFVIFHKSPPATTSSSTATTANSSNTSTSSDTTTSTGTTITYGDNGFSPSTLTVKAGTTVTIKNSSSQNMQFDSDPHPVHSDDPQLNVGNVVPGQSMTFTPTNTGTHGYHNHLNSSQTGTLVVQ